jgi:hypothetical protein
VIVEVGHEMKQAKVIKTKAGPNELFVDVEADGLIIEVFYDRVWITN